MLSRAAIGVVLAAGTAIVTIPVIAQQRPASGPVARYDMRAGTISGMGAMGAGSAMSTELGSMRVSDQVDALVTMAVNPVQYLVVPRVLAGLFMVPVLTMIFNMVGIFGAWLVCVKLLDLDHGIFVDEVRWFVDVSMRPGTTLLAKPC